MIENSQNGPEKPSDLTDDEAVREYGRQVAMDNLIREALQGRDAGQSLAENIVSIQTEKKRGRKMAVIGAWAAAACVVGMLGVSIWKMGVDSGKEIVALDDRWTLKAGADADYSIVEPNLVRLRRGELQFASLQPASLVVETPNAVATANGTHFYIGHHSETRQNQPTRKMNIAKNMTRLFVLAGIVTMSNESGSVQAAENEAAVVAGSEEAPVKIAVKANSKFATDLYARFATENEGENVFFSPYSISTALLMAAEGARGDTADEMGKVLGFPEALRRVGGDAQEIPWETGKMHTGLAALNSLFNRDRTTPEQAELLKTVKELENSLAETKAQTAKLRTDKNARKAYFESMNKERQLAEEIDAAQQQIDTLELEVANALWGEQTYPFLDTYTGTINGAYETGGLQAADFKNNFDSERLRINAWVEDKTRDRIKDLLPKGSVDYLTRLVLVNAIYFKGDWATPFDEKSTKDGAFAFADEGSSKVPLMNKFNLTGGKYAAFNGDGSFFDTPKMIRRGEKKSRYPGEDGFSIAELPYRGEEVSMVVIAPNKASGLGEIESKLNSDNLAGWIGELKNRKMHVTLPKFRSETSYKMNGTLSAMGMATAFKDPRLPGGADFGGMSKSKSPMDKLHIGLVIHKAFVDVNEKGTEAAAATVILMVGTTSMPIARPFIPHFRADRPFIYLIRDNKTGSILFLGRMMNPKA